MASWWDTINPFSGAELSDAEQARAMGAYQGLLNMGAQMMDAGRPRLVMQEGFGPGLLGGLGRGAAAFGQGMQQGRRDALANNLLDQQSRRSAAYSEAFGEKPDDQLSPQARALRGAVPASMRGLLGSMAPDAGMQTLAAIASRDQDPRRNLMAAGNGTVLRINQDGSLAPVYTAPMQPNQRFHFGPNGEVYDLQQMAGGAPQAGGSANQRAEAPVTMPTGGMGATIPANLMPFYEEASRETGIPIPILAAQHRQESNFNPNARGQVGEIGIGQVKPSTAQAPGFGVQPADPASLNDPRNNILFSARYLAGRARDAGVTDWNNPQQVATALRAYNGGGDPNYVANVGRYLPPNYFVQTAQGGGMAIPVQNGAPAPTAAAPGTQPATAAQPRPPGMIVPPRGPEWVDIPTPEGETGRWQRNNRDGSQRRVGGTNSIIDRATSEFERLDAKNAHELMTSIESAGRSAANRLMRIGQFERDLERTTTGAGSQLALTFGQLAQRFGVPESVLSKVGLGRDQIASLENIGSGSMQMLQEGFRDGSIPTQGFSNADREAFLQANVSRFNSNAGNRAIAQVMRAMAERDAEISRAWREFSSQPGRGRNAETVRAFENGPLQEIISRDVLAPILKDFGGQPAQPTTQMPGQRDPLLSPTEGPQPPAAPPAARPRARNAQGQVIEFNGSAWVPVR